MKFVRRVGIRGRGESERGVYGRTREVWGVECHFDAEGLFFM